MPCRLISSPKTGKTVTSKTWNELYNIYQDEDKADEAYAKLLSPAFRQWFGDWFNNPGERRRVTVQLGKSKKNDLGLIQNINVFIDGKAAISENGTDNMTLQIFNDGKAIVGNISLPSEFQGQGLAKHIYQATSDLINKPIINSLDKVKEMGPYYGQSEAGSRVWKNRTQFIPGGDSVSKVVTEDGEPLIVYHGTKNLFDTFDIPEFIYGADFDGDSGIFTIADKDYARSMGQRMNKQPDRLNTAYLMPLFVSIKNPKKLTDSPQTHADFVETVNVLKIKRDNKDVDGIIGIDYHQADLGDAPKGLTYVAFSQSQVKSVDNLGQFDRSNPNIYFNKPGTLSSVMKQYDTIWWNNDTKSVEERVMHPLKARELVSRMNANSDFRFKVVPFNAESAVIRVDTSTETKRVDANDNEKYLDTILSRMVDKFGIKYKIVEPEDAVQILAKQGFTRTPESVESAFFDGSTVYLVKGKFGLTDAIHEYSHPFVTALENDNPELFNKLYDDLVASPDGEIILNTVTELEYPASQVKREVFVRALTAKAKNTLTSMKSKSIVDRFWRYLKKLIRDVFGINLNALDINTTLEDLATILLSKDKVNVESAKVDTPIIEFNREYEESDPDFDEVVSNQHVSTIAQREAIETLVGMRRNATLSSDQKGYDVINPETGEIVKCTRTTDFLKSLDGPAGQKGFYGYDGPEDNRFDKNAEWGNQMDDILTAVLKGESLEIAKERYLAGLTTRKPGEARLSTEVVEELYRIFTQLKTEYPDAVLISQQILYNLQKGIAGTSDIIVVHKDGTIDILDLKSSVNPSDGTYLKTMDNGDNIETGYEKRWQNKSSKKERHQAQLSIYKGLANSQGLVTNDQSKTIHIHIAEVVGSSETGGTVTKVVRESDKNQPPIKHIADLVNSDTNYAGDPIPDIERSGELYKILLKIRETLASKKAEFASKGKDAAAYNMQKLLDQMNTTTFAGAVAMMVTESADTLLGKNNWPGWFKIISDTVNKFNSDQLTGNEAVAKLAEAKEILDLYLPVIEQMKTFYEKFNYVQQGEPIPISVDPESPLGRMRYLLDNVSTYMNLLQTELPNAQAEVLYPHIEKGISNLMVEAKAKKKALDEYRAESERRGYKPDSKFYKRREAVEKRLEREYINMYRRATLTKEEFAEMIREGHYDNIKNIFDIYVNPAISSSNEIVAAVAMATKEGFEQGRLASLDMQYDAIAAFEKYKKESGRNRDNVEEFNKGFYKTERIFTGEFDAEGNPTFKEELHFVNEVNLTAFEEAKGAFFASIVNLGGKDRSLAIRGWYQANKVAKPQKDVTVTMPDGSEVVILEGIDTILRNKAKVMSKAALDRWLKSVTREANGQTYYISSELTMPNPELYPSAEYNALTGSAKEYHNFLIGSYFKSQSKLPSMSQPGYRLPSITKTDLDRFAEKGGLSKLYKYKKESIASIQSEDLERSGEEGKAIPILYTQRSMSTNDISVDLISSILMFEDAANLYKARSEIAPIADSILDRMKGQQPIQTTSAGERVISRFAKFIGVDVTRWEKSLEDNKPAKLLAGFIDMQIYGKYKRKEMWGNWDMGKLADSIISYASFTQIGGDYILGAANWLNAAVMNKIEAHAGQFYTKEEWNKGLSRYNSHIGDFMKDFTQPYDKSVIGMLFDRYDAIQGTSRNKFGRKVSQSTAKKMFDTSSLYFNMTQGEHHIQGSSFLAMMEHYKAYDAAGKEHPLIEAYTKDADGKLAIKEGWDISHLELTDGLVAKDVRNRLHSINKSMHGVYNTFDKPILEQHATGRLLLMYRKFLVPGFKRRFQTYSANYESGEAREGYYRTFWKSLMRDWKQTIAQTLPFVKASDAGLTPLEQMNLRRASMDFAMIALTGIIVMLLRALRDSAGDDDERAKWALSYPLYTAMRLQSELRYYSRWQDLYRSFRAPTASYGIAEKAFKFVNQVTEDVLTLSPERYERDAGLAKKGDIKSLIYFYKLIGLSGRQLDPSESIKILDLQTDR